MEWLRVREIKKMSINMNSKTIHKDQRSKWINIVIQSTKWINTNTDRTGGDEGGGGEGEGR